MTGTRVRSRTRTGTRTETRTISKSQIRTRTRNQDTDVEEEAGEVKLLKSDKLKTHQPVAAVPPDSDRDRWVDDTDLSSLADQVS